MTKKYPGIEFGNQQIAEADYLLTKSTNREVLGALLFIGAAVPGVLIFNVQLTSSFGFVLLLIVALALFVKLCEISANVSNLLAMGNAHRLVTCTLIDSVEANNQRNHND